MSQYELTEIWESVALVIHIHVCEAGAWFVIENKSEPRGDEVIPVYYAAAVTENIG